MTDFNLDYLASLPVPTIIEAIEYEAILASRKADFIARAPTYGLSYDVDRLETDPGVALLEESSYRETVLRARINFIARQPYLYFAEGSSVDHLAAFYDVVRLPGESDARLKVRVILAIQGRSTGGTPARYRYVAMTADVNVADVYVYITRLDPTVHLAVFSELNNGVPSEEMLTAIRAAVNADDVKMVNDTLDVRAAVVRVINLAGNLVLLPTAPANLVTTLQASLPAQWVAESGMGRDLTLDWVKARLMAAGVYSVTMTAGVTAAHPVEVAEPHEALRIGTVTLTVTGVSQ